MNFRKLTIIVFAFISIITNAQTDIIIDRFIQMPKDSIVKTQLIADLNSFINLSQGENNNNNYVYLPGKIETFILLDEFKTIEQSRRFKDEHFYKPYLNNIVKLDSNKYLIQISYIGVNDSIPYLRTVFNFTAYRENNGFLFSSPLTENTKNWKIKIIENITVHYKDKINKNQIKEFINTQTKFDSLLKIESGKYDIFCCSNSNEVQKISGVDYKLNYNGRKNISFSYNQEQTTYMVTTVFGEHFDYFDPHDLFHWRAVKAVSRDMYNHYMVCGCAYVYGGSWGISWEEIKTIFKTKMLDNTKKDWLKLYLERYNFGESQEKHLLVTQFINALIIEKTQKEKGFTAVIKLLNSGSFRRDKEQFFDNLNMITGINENNFNKKVEELFKNL